MKKIGYYISKLQNRELNIISIDLTNQNLSDLEVLPLIKQLDSPQEHVAKIQELLLDGNQISNTLKCTILLQFARQGLWKLFRSIFSALINNSDINPADINLLDNYGQSVLWLMAFDDQWDMFKILLNKLLAQPDLEAHKINSVADGISVLWLLAAEYKWDLFMIFLDALILENKINPDNLVSGKTSEQIEEQQIIDFAANAGRHDIVFKLRLYCLKELMRNIETFNASSLNAYNAKGTTRKRPRACSD